MIQETDAVVIGAGPVGLFQVFQLGLQGITAHLIDALPHAGGQCVELYGDKPIYDIPGIPVCTGRELADLLLQQIAPFKTQWHLSTLRDSSCAPCEVSTSRRPSACTVSADTSVFRCHCVLNGAICCSKRSASSRPVQTGMPGMS